MSGPPKLSEKDPRGGVSRLFRNTSVYAFGRFATSATSALFAPIYTALLAPEAYGLWTLAAMISTGLNLVFNPALHGAITRFFFTHEEDDRARRRFQGTLASFLLAWSTGLSLLLLASGPWLFERLLPSFPFWPYGALVIVSAWLGMAGVIPRAVWAAREQSKRFVGASLLSSMVRVFGALALVAGLGWGVIGLFWAGLAANVVVAIPYGRHLVTQVGLAWSPSDLKTALRFSLPLVPHLMAHWILSMSDRVILERWGGLEVVGIYGVAYAFIGLINTVAMSMNRAFVPIFTRSFGQPDEAPVVARSITYFVFAIVAMATALTLLSPWLVRHLLNSRYVEAASVAPILTMGGLFQGLYYIYAAGLFYHAKNGLVPVVTIASGAVNIGLNFLFIPTYGAHGAAFATLIGYAVLALGMRQACLTVTKLPFERRRLSWLAASALPIVAAGLALDGVGAPWMDLGIKLGLLSAGLLFLRWSGFWTDEEWRQMCSRLRFGKRSV